MAATERSVRRVDPPDQRWVREHYAVDVSVVICNYNARDMLAQTLASLFESSPHRSFEVVVVDNASSDGSSQLVRTRFPRVRLIQNARNVGLARANNQGMLAAEGRHLLLLNNDTLVRPGAIDALAEYLDKQPGVGAVGSKVLNPDGSVQGTVKSHPTPLAALFGRKSILTRLFPGNPISRRYLVYLDQDFSQPFAAGSVSCCAVMVRREAIERAGPMDERFFVYWCDVDWCRSIWEADFEVHCNPASVIVHDEHKGGSRATRRSTFAVRDFHRGAYLYYRKWQVPHAWHPSHGLALAGLAGRALAIMGIDWLKWELRRLGRAV